MRSYPPEIRVRPRGPLDATVRVPGSKSITNRAALVAALARGESELAGCLDSDDTEAMREALGALGVVITVRGDIWTVRGANGVLRAPRAPLDARASGTTARFLTAAATLADGPVEIDGAPRMRERPIQDLVDCLRALGAGVDVLGAKGCPPLRVHPGLRGGRAPIDARRSSQFVSAVLMAAPYAREDVTLDPVEGVMVSTPYVDLTLAVMRAFGADARWSPHGSLHVTAGRHYEAARYTVECDASAAAYPFCAAAIAGGRVRVAGVPEGSLQADFRLLDVLERMGCAVTREPGAVTVARAPEASLAGVDVDMNEMPDAVLALAVVALFADGPTRIENVANLRIKETDRLAALERELAKLGARAEAGPDWLAIEPGPLRGAAIDTYDDHRMAMSFALAGLRVPGVVIRDPGCVAKTWPDFFAMLDAL